MSIPDNFGLVRWRSPYDICRQPVDGAYSRAVWLPRLGPTSWLLWITLARQLGPHGHLVSIDAEAVAASLGIGHPGRRYKAVTRPMLRLRNFRLARVDDDAQVVQIRQFAQPGPAAVLAGLPPTVRELHEAAFGAPPSAPV